MLLLRPHAEASDPVDSASLRIPTSGQAPLLSLRQWVLNTQKLAHMLDSLVRVSRRVNENRIVSIANPLHETLESTLTTAQNFILYRRLGTLRRYNCAECRFFSSIPDSW